MRLQKLTGLERDKIRDEYAEVKKHIEELLLIIEHKYMRSDIIKAETLEMKAKYGDARKTEIVMASHEFNPEDFYANDKVAITISHLGYIKRTLLSDICT